MRFLQLIAMFSVLVGVVSVANGENSHFQFGERPENSIFDPVGFLTPKEHKEISESLFEILEKENIELFIVILPDIGEAPPQHVVKDISSKWSSSKFNAVVLHVPSHEETPWIFPGKFVTGSLKTKSLNDTIDAAEKRAAAEQTDFRKVRAAAVEAADAMRYWRGNATLRTEHLISMRLKWALERERKERLLKLSAAIGAAALIPLTAMFVMLVIKIRKRMPRRFPKVRKIPRLGAPYSGGNSVISNPNK